MRVFVFSIFFIIINYNLSYSATFKNFAELNKCIKSYSSYIDYKNKIQKCFLNQNIKINDEGINLIKKNIPQANIGIKGNPLSVVDEIRGNEPSNIFKKFKYTSLEDGIKRTIDFY